MQAENSTDPAAAAGFQLTPCALRWILVFTKPAGERIAQANLERQGYRVYYPRLSRPAFKWGQWVERIASLFPRYLFIQVDARYQSLAPVSSTLGVANVVRFGLEPAVVSDAIVRDLLVRADPQTGLHRLSGSRGFEAGARVSIAAGTFDGLEGVFQSAAGKDRVTVLLNLLGRELPVRIPARFVAPCLVR